MGLFSKLFGDNKDGKNALDQAKGLFNEAGKSLGDFANTAEKMGAAFKEGFEQERQGGGASASFAAEEPAGQAASFAGAAAAAAVPGCSWGPVMPAEENQFNYPGTYIEYFDHVFKTEFPEYRITCENARNYTATIFIFWNGPQRALVVELLPQHSAAVKLKNDCRANGTPYLRYYYDHEGWWNTYSYVRDRTRAALG